MPSLTGKRPTGKKPYVITSLSKGSNLINKCLFDSNKEIHRLEIKNNVIHSVRTISFVNRKLLFDILFLEDNLNLLFIKIERHCLFNLDDFLCFLANLTDDADGFYSKYRNISLPCTLILNISSDLDNRDTRLYLTKLALELPYGLVNEFKFI